jgi:hypothetical protein
MEVTYKIVGDNCKYSITPLVSNFGEVMTVDGARRRQPANSGLIINSEILYEIGSLLQIDLKFEGDEFSYRGKGIVTWMKKNSSDFTLGVVITGMDKLDKFGMSITVDDGVLEELSSFDTMPDWWPEIEGKTAHEDAKRAAGSGGVSVSETQMLWGPADLEGDSILNTLKDASESDKK